jgi:iron complex transport system ATP-binding protein
VDEPFIGFITAVKLTNAVVVEGFHAGVEALCVATVGVANATRPGETVAGGYVPGTINLVVVIDAAVAANALNEALAIAVEAKALAVYEGGVRTRDGRPATGTSTDAIAVACTGKGPMHQYAGSVTAAGFAIANVVREAVASGLGPAMKRAEEAAQ